MRLSTRGVHWLNVSLSISSDPNRGLTRVLLHGCTAAQQSAIQSQTEAQPIASTEHPLFLPVALLAIKQRIICQEEVRLWAALTEAEMFTGVTRAPIIGDQHQPSADLREKKRRQRNYEKIDWANTASYKG